MSFDSVCQFESICHALDHNQKQGIEMQAAVISVDIDYLVAPGANRLDVIKMTLGFDHTTWSRARFLDRLQELANDARTLDIRGVIWFSQTHWLESYDAEFSTQWRVQITPEYPQTGDDFPYGVFKETVFQGRDPQPETMELDQFYAPEDDGFDRENDNSENYPY